MSDTTINWMSRLQKRASLSTTEVEYVAISRTSKEKILVEEFSEGDK